MKTRDIIEKAGGVEEVARRFGKNTAYVRRLQYGAVLPAAWYDALERMTGEELPRELFSFKAEVAK